MWFNIAVALGGVMFLGFLIAISAAILRALEKPGRFLKTSFFVLLGTCVLGTVASAILLVILWFVSFCVRPWNAATAHLIMVNCWEPVMIAAYVISAILTILLILQLRLLDSSNKRTPREA